jgi:hypothetical protein
MMMSTGMLGEGTGTAVQYKLRNSLYLDGIHVDMDHLKKGEVK